MLTYAEHCTASGGDAGEGSSQQGAPNWYARERKKKREQVFFLLLSSLSPTPRRSPLSLSLTHSLSLSLSLSRWLALARALSLSLTHTHVYSKKKRGARGIWKQEELKDLHPLFPGGPSNTSADVSRRRETQEEEEDPSSLYRNGNTYKSLDTQHAWCLVKIWDKAALLPRFLLFKSIKTETYRFCTKVSATSNSFVVSVKKYP